MAIIYDEASSDIITISNSLGRFKIKIDILKPLLVAYCSGLPMMNANLEVLISHQTSAKGKLLLKSVSMKNCLLFKDPYFSAAIVGLGGYDIKELVERLL